MAVRTTLFDYINRAMPFDRPTVMSADDVYRRDGLPPQSDGVIAEQDVMDAKTLPADAHAQPRRVCRRPAKPDAIKKK